MALRPAAWQAEADDLPPEEKAFGALEPEGHQDLTLDDDGNLVPVEPETGEPMLSPDEDPWTANLAENVTDTDLNVLANEIADLVKDDISSRSEWAYRLDRGLALMGLKKHDLDDGPFPGAASVVHPVLTEAIVQFWARAMPELFPAEGPAKGKVRGKQTDPRVEAATRVADHMNYQMTEEDRGYRNECSRSLFAVAAHGGAYKKTFRNTLLDTTQGIYVPAEHFIVPYTATSLDTAPRFTHRMRKTPNEVKKAQVRGEWRKCELMKPSDDEETEEETTKAEIEGKTPTQNDKDARHEIYETYIDLHIPKIDKEAADKDEIELPYIVTIEVSSRKVLSIRRNWRQNDEMREKRVYFTPYEFVPGFGFYPLGLFHLIGGLSEAATGSLRVLLDGAATASLQGGFVSKDVAGKIDDDGALIIEPGKYKPIDATAEELKVGFFTPPFKEPTMVLYQLLGFLIDSAQRLASTTETMTGDADTRSPVGTTLAMIEQGMKVFSTVHAGLHASMRHELGVRFEINKEYCEDGYKYDVEGDEREVYKQDYMAHSTDIKPVADPNIFSVTQRLAISQATYQLAQENPDIYDKIEVHKRLHQAMKTPDFEKLLIDPMEMAPLDPVMENQCLLTMKPIRVFPEQDHQSHLTVHLSFLQNPGFGAHPEVAPLIEAQAKAHIAQHLAALYAQHASSMGIPAGTINFAAQRPSEIGTPEQVQVGAMAAQMAAQLAQVPGLPPPPEQGREAEMEQELRHADDVHKQSMAHKDEAFKQELEQKAIKFQDDEKIAQVKTASDETRKDEAFVNEEARADAKTEKELERQDVAVEKDLGRKDTAAEKEQRRKDQAIEAEQIRKNVASEQEGRRKDQAHAQKTEHTAQAHKMGSVEQALSAVQAAIQKELDHEQKGKHGDEDHKRKASQEASGHKRAAKFAEEDHESNLQRGDRDHKQESKFREDDHKQAAKQKDEAHKQAVKQADDKAKRDAKAKKATKPR